MLLKIRLSSKRGLLVTSQDGAAAAKSRTETNPVTRRASVARWRPGRELAVIGIGIAATATTYIVGLFAIPSYMILIAACAFTAIGGLITWAAKERAAKNRVKILWLTLVVALAIPVVALMYHYLNQSYLGSSFLAKGNAAEIYSEPTLSTSTDTQQVATGTVSVMCFINMHKTGAWYELLIKGSRFWIQASSVYPIPDTQSPQVPHC